MACKYTAKDLKGYFNKLGRQLGKYVTNLDGLDPADALKSFRVRILEKGDDNLLDIVDALIESKYPTYAEEVIEGDADISYEEDLLPAEYRSIGTNVIQFDQLISDVEADADNREDSEGEFEELGGNNTFNKKISELNMANFDALYNHFTGQEHNKEQIKQILEQIRYSENFDEFYEWVVDPARGYDIITADMEAKRNPIYYVDKEVTMKQDSRFRSKDGSGDAIDVWIVPNIEAAYRQLSNIKNGKGMGTLFEDELEPISEGYWLLRHKNGDHKYIYAEDSPSKPDDQYLLADDQGRTSGSMYYNYKEAFRKVEDRRRGLRTFYNVYNSVIHRSNRYEFIIANIDPNLLTENLDNSIGMASLNDDGSKKSPRLIRTLPYDLKNKISKSDWIAMNFIDASEATIRGHKISDPGTTGYFNLGQSGSVKTWKEIKDPKTGKIIKADWFFIPLSLKNVTEKSISNWEYALSNQHAPSTTYKGKEYSTPFVMVMPTPGDTSTFFTTRVLPEQINELFPKKELVKALKENGNKNYAEEVSKLLTDESIINWYKTKQSIYETSNYQDKTKDDDGISLGQKKHGDKWDTRFKGIEASFFKLQEIVTKIGQNNWKIYLDRQLKKGNISKIDRKNMLESSSLKHRAKVQRKKTYKYVPITAHLGSLIARHEWLQSIRGDNYMLHEDGNIWHTMTRLKINKTMGIIAEGSGDTDRIVYDQNKHKILYTNPETGVEEEMENIVEYFGAKYNLNDGASFYSTAKMNAISAESGSYPLSHVDVDSPHEFWPKELKSVVSEMTFDDKGNWNGYFELKHAGFVPPPGLKIVDLKGNTVIETVEEMGEIRIYGPDGIIDSFSDRDAAKTLEGKRFQTFDKRGYVPFTTKESSERIITTPHYTYSKTVYGLMSYLNSLNYTFTNKRQQADFDSFKDTILKLSRSTSDIYIDALIEADLDPDRMRNLLNYVYENLDGKIDDFRLKLENTQGLGIHHPDYMVQARAILTNMLIKNGMMKLHTHTDKIQTSPDHTKVFGSSYVMSPDMKRQVKDDEHVILSADNQVLYNQIVLKAETLHNYTINSIENMNTYLEKHPEYALTYRAPILHLTSVASRRIQMFVEDQGNSIFHHPRDVFIRMTGDHDIDSSGAILLDNRSAEKINDFQRTKFYKAQASIHAALDIFEVSDANSLSNISDVKQAWMTTLRGVGIQGKAKNMKDVSATISRRFNSIEFEDGQVVIPKKPTDIVIMDYAPLKDITQEMKDNLPFGAEIVFDKNTNEHYLKTTVAHEHLLIANAATDYANKKLRGLLFNKWGLEHDDWYTDRMFKVKGGGTLSIGNYKVLRNLKQLYTYSDQKKLRKSKSKRKMNYGLALFSIEKLRNRLEMSVDDHTKWLIDETAFKVKDGLSMKIHSGVKNVDMNDVITPEEEMIIRPLVRIREEYGHDTIYPLLGQSTKRGEVAHLTAKKDLDTKYMNPNTTEYTLEQWELGYNLAQEYRIKFYGKLEELADRFQVNDDKLEGDKDDFINVKKAEYDEELSQINNDFVFKGNLKAKIISLVDAVELEGEAVREIMTLYLVGGMDFQNNISYLPALKVGKEFLLSPKIHKEYMGLYENNYFNNELIENYSKRDYKNVKGLKDKSKTTTLDQFVQYLNDNNKREC